MPLDMQRVLRAKLPAMSTVHVPNLSVTSARMAVSAVWIAVAQDLPVSIEQSRRVVADDRGGIFK